MLITGWADKRHGVFLLKSICSCRLFDGHIGDLVARLVFFQTQKDQKKKKKFAMKFTENHFLFRSFAVNLTRLV